MYKGIAIAKKLSAADVAAVKFFNRRANPDHIYLSHTDGALTVHLRQLNPEAMRPLFCRHRTSTILEEVYAALVIRSRA